MPNDKMLFPPIHATYTCDKNGHVSNVKPKYGFFDPMGRGNISKWDFDEEKQILTIGIIC